MVLEAGPGALLEQQISEIMDQYGPNLERISESGSDNEAVSSRIVQASASSYSNGLNAADQLAVRTAANSYIRASEFTSLQSSVAAYQAMNLAYGSLAAVVNRLPRVIGAPAVRILSVLHKPVELLGTNIARRAAEIAPHLLHDHVQSTGWAANESGFVQRLIADAGLVKPINLHGTGPLTPSDAISGLESSVNYLLNQLGKIEYALGHEQASNSTPPQVWNELHSLQGDVARIVSAQNALALRLDAADRAIEVQNNQIAELAGSLHGLRQVSTGWQDVKMAVDNLARNTQAQIATVTSNQARDHVHLQELLPLSLLLQPGIKGVEVLRQLEDTPCMCPKIPDISGIPGELLGIYEFITHG